MSVAESWDGVGEQRRGRAGWGCGNGEEGNGERPVLDE